MGGAQRCKCCRLNILRSKSYFIVFGENRKDLAAFERSSVRVVLSLVSESTHNENSKL